MRGFLWLVVTTLGSVGFQVSVLLWPQKFAHYAWLVPYVWMAWGVVCLSLLITHEKILGRKLKKLWGIEEQPSAFSVSSPTLPPINTKSESNPTQTLNQSGIKFEQHIHAPQPQAVPPKPVVKPEEPKRPNVIFLAGTTTRIREGRSSTFYEAEGRDLLQSDPYAVIAAFRNEPLVGKKVASVYARACLVFRDGSGEEIGAGVSEACWLGDSGSVVEFSVGDSHKVILALFMGGTLICPYRRIKHTDWGSGITTDSYTLNKDTLKTIEVRIVHRDELLLEPIVFYFSVVDGRPTIWR